MNFERFESGCSGMALAMAADCDWPYGVAGARTEEFLASRVLAHRRMPPAMIPGTRELWWPRAERGEVEGRAIYEIFLEHRRFQAGQALSRSMTGAQREPRYRAPQYCHFEGCIK